jgi:N-acyl-D-aspartate/D-glutamate deacylase
LRLGDFEERAMLDLKIIGGVIVDGTGEPRFHGDLGIRDGRIVALGEVSEPAHETLDATGKIVAPGFIDTHTHYDAQVFWDPTLSPSCYHGVTTIFGGFCGFSIAPMTPAAATYIKPMLARVEGMPLATLDAAVPWNSWGSFGDYLALIEGKVGLNVGFFAGHSAIRRIVMGARAVGEKASAEDLATMQALLARSLEEGALGFSTTLSPTHNDAAGDPVPSRWAEPSELLGMAEVVKRYPGAGLELLPDLDFPPGMPELLADFSKAGDRPVNWNVLAVNGRPDAAERADEMLKVSDVARARGGEVIALTVPCTPNLFMSFKSGAGFDSNLGIWREVFRLPIEARIAKFKDPAVRRQMAIDADATPAESPLKFLAKIEHYIVVSVTTPEHKKYEGRRIDEIAATEGREPIDVILDIAVADDLLATFMPDQGGDDVTAYEIRGRLWKDDRTMVGASDAGAHLDMIDTFAFSTTLIEKGVREFGVISLEEAVHQITGRAAQYMGLVDRGTIAVGKAADLVIFGEATIKRGPTYMRYDVPGNEGRVYADAQGIDHVFVNGVAIIRDGQHTGALPGAVLRSGKDTRTVLPGAMRDARTPVGA